MPKRRPFQIPVRDPNRPKVPEVKALVREYYEKPGNSVGGALHVVLEDKNLKNGNLTWAIEHARCLNDEDAAKIAELMLQMTPTQRRKLT